MPIPAVEISDIVLWYPDGDPEVRPLAAVVTNVGAHSLNLNIFDPRLANFIVRDGVLHISDPRCGGPHVRESGGWDLSPAIKRLQIMEETAQFLLQQVHELERMTKKVSA